MCLLALIGFRGSEKQNTLKIPSLKIHMDSILEPLYRTRSDDSK